MRFGMGILLTEEEDILAPVTKLRFAALGLAKIIILWILSRSNVTKRVLTRTILPWPTPYGSTRLGRRPGCRNKAEDSSTRAQYEADSETQMNHFITEDHRC